MGGYGPIPWLTIRDYAIVRGYGEDEQEGFIQLIRAMDDALISHQAKKAENGG